MKTSVFTLIILLMLQMNALVQAGEVSCAHKIVNTAHVNTLENVAQSAHSMHMMQTSQSTESHTVGNHTMNHEMSHQMDCCQDECQCDISGCHVHYAGAIESQLGFSSLFINPLVASELVDAPQEYLSFLFKPPINS